MRWCMDTWDTGIREGRHDFQASAQRHGRGIPQNHSPRNGIPFGRDCNGRFLTVSRLIAHRFRTIVRQRL